LDVVLPSTGTRIFLNMVSPVGVGIA